ncbi:MAG: meso-butanediol dehydrogenase / (S,S)-butanediol dehydrogenase / diacetyl reductase [Idiomarinaceae bacterium HL-53]|nr:MAG: meso-butanediol dehydrogenase / (S,S)-butanediol dehydrogenase / diacetyl reductase [Idiomarinaceae bacterium HL-53]CUS49328.1 NAD(P)-dependent dehydrogenase, short-chain alcohol dehydrogenase family [Idiomarinaceae bacterium HL-53]
MSSNLVAFVSGAAAGIGKAAALAYAQKGCDLVLTDVQAEKLHDVADLARSMDVKVLAKIADVTNEKDMRQLHHEAFEFFGRLDFACNNAGIEGIEATFTECSMDNFDRVMNVNARSVFVCMQEQLKIMQQQRAGAIVNVSSIAGLVGFPARPAYCASKGAVIQLTRAAAIEYAADNVRVNAICPGVIHTDMIDRVTQNDPEIEAAYAAFHPMNRMGTVAEVADTILFLSMPESGFITGQALAVDGGMVAR